MDEIYELYKYLPIYSASEQGYIDFLKRELENSYNAKAYQAAYLISHMIFIFYVFSCIWKIKYIYNDRYCYGIIGFADKKDIDLRELSSIYNLSLVPERTIFNVFKLIDMDKGEIGKLKKIINVRNNIAHPTGHIDFETEEQFREGISKLIEHCEIVHKTMADNLIKPAYENYLLSNKNEEEWEYPTIKDQVKEILLHSHRLSQSEFAVCCGFGVSKFSDRKTYQLNEDEIQTIRNLHNAVKQICIEDFGYEDSA